MSISEAVSGNSGRGKSDDIPKGLLEPIGRLLRTGDPAATGIVDLFACEMDTLCRIVLVVGSVPRSIETFKHGLPGRNGGVNSVSPTRHFTSEENYFPVFASYCTRSLASPSRHWRAQKRYERKALQQSNLPCGSSTALKKKCAHLVFTRTALTETRGAFSRLSFGCTVSDSRPQKPR